MKKIAIVLLLSMFSVGKSFAQCRAQAMGPEDKNQPSHYQADEVASAIDGENNMYVASLDYEGKHLTVTRYNGNSWEDLSYDLVSTSAITIDLAVSPEGIAFLAYGDEANNRKLVVKKFVNHSWTVVGVAGMSEGWATDTKIMFDKHGTPYVGYKEENFGRKIIIKKFDGSSWVNVGPPAFGGIAYYTAMTIDDNGKPYVAYINTDAFNNIKVCTFDGISWVEIGSSQITSIATYNISLATDSEQHLYIAYIDMSSAELVGKASVKKYDGTTWTAVGTLGFTSSQLTSNMSLVLDADDVPHLLFSEVVNNRKSTVMSYKDGAWTILGNQSFSVGRASMQDLLLGSDGAWYAGYAEQDYFDIYAQYPASIRASVNKLINNEWKKLGADPISDAQAENTSLAVAPNGVSYVAYRDGAYNLAATVKAYDGITWHTIGQPGFTAGKAENISIAIDGNSKPYIVFSDYTQGYRLTVMSYTGFEWELVGQAGFSINDSYWSTLAFDPSGTPHVAYSNGFRGKTTVMKYNGAQWVLVGNANFSEGISFGVSLDFDKQGVPYVAYSDISQEYATCAVVKKYQEGSWTLVGAGKVSSEPANNVTLVLDNNDKPYVAYTNDNTFSNGKMMVMTFDGTAWVAVGSDTGFSNPWVEYCDFAIDNNNVPYVAYTDLPGLSKAVVKKYNGSDWIDVITPNGFSAGRADYITLAIDGNNHPCIAFCDGGVYAYQLTCEEITTGVEEEGATTKNAGGLLVYPNPTTSEVVTVELEQDALIQITDLLGRIVKEEKAQVGKHELTLSALSKGIYLVKVSNGASSQAVKLIKEN